MERLAGTREQRARSLLDGGADAVARHPLFLRLFYMLALEATEDEAAAELIRRARDRAFEYFRTAIALLLIAEQPDEQPAEVAAGELARFAVAYSDGCFFAGQLEPDRADLRRMYGELWVALRALAPGAIARATASDRP